MKSLLPILATAAIAPCAFAQGADDSGWYAGIGYESLQETDGPYDYQALDLTGGYNFNRFLGVEVTGAVGIDGDGIHHPESTVDTGNGSTTTFPSMTTTVDLSHRIDLLGVGRLPVTDRITLVGKAGVSHYKYDYSFRMSATPDFPNSSSISSSPSGYGFTAGAGAELALTDSISVTGGYNYYKEQGVFDGDVEGFQIGLKRRF